MDYGAQYSTTSYSAGGGANGGGFLTASQGGGDSTSPSGKRQYGKDTLRPVTIKQLNEAHHPSPDAEYFIIDGQETTQVTFVGQIRNISAQTTNVTYKLDDGTSTMEVKQWIDAEAVSYGADIAGKKEKLKENDYARVWGRMKAFNNRRHVGAQTIRPVTDLNEISYHLLEATVVHLHFTRGPPGDASAGQGANGGHANGGAQPNGGMDGYGDRTVPTNATAGARKVFNCIKNTPQTNEGLHVQDIAARINLDVSDVLRAGEELQGLGLVYTTVDDQTWAILDV